jgi:energy-coupling factor transport system substrate-specific component
MSGSMASSFARDKNRPLIIVGVILLGGLFNCLLSLANVAVGSPFFFDSIFTALVGAVWGPLAGVICAIVTHGFLIAVHRWDITWIYFLPCSMATGAITGAFAKRRVSKDIRSIILCSVSVTLANSLLGAIIAAFAYGGITTHPSDYIVTGLILAGQSFLAASFWARIPLNLIDKTIAVVIAFAARRYFRE